MIRALATIVLIAGLAQLEPTRATAGGGEFDPDVVTLLGAMDFVPSRDHLEEVMGPAPVEELSDLIGITEPSDAEPGVRLRAVRALAEYPGDEARAALRAVILQYSAEREGFDLLILRAAIEGLAIIGGAGAVPDIVPFLWAEESRDLRATAAIALGVIGAEGGAVPLSDRQRSEQVPQVKLAITEALRAILEQD